MNPRTFHLSASSIAAFKACPQRWRLMYEEGIRPVQDTDSLRQGTAWHKMHEVYAAAGRKLADEDTDGLLDVDDIKQYALNAVIEWLNETYKTAPTYKTPEEWALERQILLTSFVAYIWYWQNDPYEVLASEVPFELPVRHPITGLPLATKDVVRVGKIDHIIKWQGMIGPLERKSTSRSIAPDSNYWDKGKKDTQVSMYALAMRDMTYDQDGERGIAYDVPWHPGQPYTIHIPGEQAIGNTLYDVWHKPTIKPAMLTQKETAECIESKEYYGQKFQIEVGCGEKSTNPPIPYHGVLVNQTPAEVEEGKKGFAIRETIDMYGARLLADIQERPDFYFARREIVRTDAELKKFKADLYNVYQTQRLMSKTGHFYENEAQCRATYPCPMIPICYGPGGAEGCCDGTTVPNNFKRIFVDFTVNEQAVD